MCGGVLYSVDRQQSQTYFPNPYVKLPVRKRSGGIELLPWGHRQRQPGKLPMGGWARHESIQEGRWDRWNLTPVKLVVDEFMEKDHSSSSDGCFRGLSCRLRVAQHVHMPMAYVD